MPRPEPTEPKDDPESKPWAVVEEDGTEDDHDIWSWLLDEEELAAFRDADEDDKDLSTRVDLDREASIKAWDTRGRSDPEAKPPKPKAALRTAMNDADPAVMRTVFDKNFAVDDLDDMFGSLPTKPGGAVSMTYNTYDAQGLGSGLQVSAMVDFGSYGEVQLTRTFSRNANGDLRVRHANFELPEHLRGQGIAKQVLADSIKVYQKLGVKEINTEANLEVGAYAWARFGFKAKNPQKLADDVMDAISTMRLSPEQRRAVVQVVNRHATDPRLPWMLASLRDGDFNLGRRILTTKDTERFEPISWQATLDFTDQEAMNRLHRYIHGQDD